MEGPGASRRKRILVVDDDVDVADTLCDLLDAFGFEARAAYDGMSALSAASHFHPDVAVLDLRLPDLPGDEVCRLLRARHATPIEIIALTGTSNPENTVGAGCFDHCLLKPVGAAVLLDVLQGPRPS
jgi:DNA-binding response OmpR family regulator